MQRAWYGFASAPWHGLYKELGWPKWRKGEESLVLLGMGNKAQPEFVDPAVYDAPCSTVTMGALGTSAPVV
jgi:hypothetical protein